jgi:hypothetical protein
MLIRKAQLYSALPEQPYSYRHIGNVKPAALTTVSEHVTITHITLTKWNVLIFIISTTP